LAEIFSDFSDKTAVVKLMGRFNEEVSQEVKTGFMQEVAVMFLVSHHTNIAKVIGYCLNPLCIVMKYYEGSLNELLRLKTKLTKRKKVWILMDITYGVQCIHQYDIVHCDLKTENVLVEYLEDKKRLNCVITDFGICELTSSKALKVSNFKVSQIKGLSYSYAAPEIFPSKGIKVTSKSRDVYALGVMMWEILVQRSPWPRP
jgi:eukaryotic-like serine/threonine-protein kinase